MSEETFRIVVTVGVAMVALSAIAMAFVAIGMFRAMARIQAKSDGFFDRMDPILTTLKKMADENAPKMAAIATNAEAVAANAKEISVDAKEISHVAREQAYRFAIVGDDIAHRTRAQAAKMDALVDEAVVQVHVAGVQVKKAVMSPVREASGVAAGIKAAVTTYAAANRRPGMEKITQDEEMFI